MWKEFTNFLPVQNEKNAWQKTKKQLHMVPKDTYKHKGMRLKMVEGLLEAGISDERVLEAMLAVPRHFFFEKAFLEKAYENRAFPIGENQTISQPYTVAYQTELLQTQVGHKVLEIGTGSGYQACVLAEMGCNVISMERNKRLHAKAKAMLPHIGYGRIKLIFGDGNLGAPDFEPFDRIIVTAAATEIPKMLVEQLAVGGIMVIPVGGKVQQMLLLTKTSETEHYIEEGPAFRFVPLLKGEQH